MTKTLYIGLGGLGTRVVSEIKTHQYGISSNVSRYVVLDRDYNDLFNCAQKSEIPFIDLSLHKPLRYYIDLFKPTHNIEEWFPTTPTLLCSNVEHIGMIRAVGRLSFLCAMESGHLNMIEDLLNKTISADDTDDNLQVVIVTSLAGGTGSGCFIQLALWIRNQLDKKNYSNYNIDGLFVGSEVFIDLLRHNRKQCEEVRGNTYAALNELDAISKIKQGETGEFSSSEVYLDGLLNSSLHQTGNRPVYDRIYIYDSSNSLSGTCESFDEHISKIARLLCLRFDSVATDSRLQIEQYLSASTDLKEAYLNICNHAKQLSLSYYNPHIDKRWMTLFNSER